MNKNKISLITFKVFPMPETSDVATIDESAADEPLLIEEKESISASAFSADFS